MTKARMVLVGRSAAPDLKKDKTHEIAQTLQRFKDENLNGHYYQCDVTDEKNVQRTIQTIEEQFGKITGFIHGAGLNSIKRLKQTTFDDAFNESLPKVMGAVNVCKALSNQPLKLIAGITSIIGLTGMEGSGWYGLANEILNLYLHQFKNQHPKTHVVTVAYSVWDEIGMGARLGSIDRLAQKGISAIPVEEGVKRFRQLIENDPGTQQVIVAARIAGMSTWKSQTIKESHFRFIEKIEYILPGVELIAKANLNVKDDAYLLDHNWKGSLLFPFVFGFEAMVQASYALLKVEEINNLLATNIQLNRPIIISKDRPTTIHIRTIKDESISKVSAQVYCDLDNFTDPYFSADIQINADYKIPNNSFNSSEEEKSDINPKEDLYGKILFQGRMFQYLKDIYEAKYDENKKEGSCIFSLEEEKGSKYLIGSPYVIDSVLQSMQLVFANTFSLPQAIDLLFVKPFEIVSGLKSLTKVSQVDLSYLKGNNISKNNGEVVLSISNCRLKILETKSNFPNINDIKDPSHRDNIIFDNFINKLSRIDGIILPKVSFNYSAGFANKNRNERRVIIRQLLEKLGFKGEIDLTYTKDNKPIINIPNNKISQISISHKGNYLLLSLGNTVQGIDIEDVQELSIDEWQSILNPTGQSVLNQLLSVGVDLNIAGSCAWSIIEVLYKATKKSEDKINYEGIHQGCYLFSSNLLGENSRILFGRLELTRGREKLCTFIVNNSLNNQKDTPPRENISIDSLSSLGFSTKELCGMGAEYKGPRDQLVFKCHFPVTFKNTQSFSKSVYFTNYFDFCGTLREYSIFPILKDFLGTAKSGKTSMVTKMTSLDVYRPVRIGDILEGRLWMDELKGSKESTMNMCYEWYVINREKPYKVADCKQDTIWIKIDDSGKAEIDEYPSYLKKYADLMKPRTTREKSKTIKKENLFTFYSGEELDILGSHLPNKYKLHQKLVLPTLENSNLLSNIYFSSFAKWIGQLSDEYFHKHLPDFYKDYTGQKEVYCSHCSIDFFNEVFPFEPILIEVFINKIFEKGVELYYEFHHMDGDRKVKKLAMAKQQVLFVSIFNDEILAMKIPDQLLKTLKV